MGFEELMGGWMEELREASRGSMEGEKELEDWSGWRVEEMREQEEEEMREREWESILCLRVQQLRDSLWLYHFLL